MVHCPFSHLFGMAAIASPAAAQNGFPGSNLPPLIFDTLDSGLLSVRISTIDYPDGFVAGKIGDAAALADPRIGNAYLDFHTSSFPDGKLRGQLVPAAFGLAAPTSSAPREPAGREESVSPRFDRSSGSIVLSIADQPDRVAWRDGSNVSRDGGAIER